MYVHTPRIFGCVQLLRGAGLFPGQSRNKSCPALPNWRVSISRVQVCNSLPLCMPMECILRAGDRPYSPKRFDGQPGDEFQSLVGVDGAQSVGLAIVGSHFSQEFYCMTHLPKLSVPILRVFASLFLWQCRPPKGCRSCFPSHPEKASSSERGSMISV